MKLKIKKHKVYCNTNILGKPINSYTFYTIDKVFMGIFNFAIRFTSRGNVLFRLPKNESTTFCAYTSSDNASQFQSIEEAQEFLDDIKSNPDKYIRIE